MAAPTAQELMRAMLLDNNGAGNWTGGGGAVDHARARDWAKFQQSNIGRLYANDPTKQREMFEQQRYGGGFPFQYGVTPNESDLNRWVNKAIANQSGGQQGGQMVQAQQGMAGGGRGMVARTGSAAGAGPQAGGFLPGAQPGGMGGGQMSLLDMLAFSSMADFNKRNQAVKARENEIRQSKDALYGRTMERLDNYGKAEEARIKDSYEKRLNDQLAYLADRGLGNATISASYIGDRKRDESQDLTDLSERLDDRRIRHDIPLTQNKEDFVERIVDRGPDMSQIMQLAQQLGMSGMGGGMLGGMLGGGSGQVQAALPGAMGGSSQAPQAAQYMANQSMAANQGPTMTPWGPIKRASFFPEGRQPVNTNIFPGNPLNPLGMVQNIMGGVASLVGANDRPLVSNRYPGRNGNPDSADNAKLRRAMEQQERERRKYGRLDAYQNKKQEANRYSIESLIRNSMNNQLPNSPLQIPFRPGYSGPRLAPGAIDYSQGTGQYQIGRGQNFIDSLGNGGSSNAGQYFAPFGDAAYFMGQRGMTGPANRQGVDLSELMPPSQQYWRQY